MTERRRHDDRTRFLARAAESLALSLDYGSTLETLAHLPVPFLADLCIVDLMDGGQVRIGAVAASDPDTEALATAVRQKYPLRLDAHHLATVAGRRGPRLFRDCSGETLQDFVQNEDHRRLIARMGITSAMVLPLVAGGQTLGSMLFVSTSVRRRYSEADLALAGELADRAGIAIDNARLYRELQESNRLKDEFLGTVSHELRTPLNAVLGWTTILRRGAADPSVTTRALSAIERNAKAQAQLVEDLLDTSRIVSGKLRIDASPIDISGIVQGAVDSFGPLARARSTDLSATCEDGLPPVLADTIRLQQVIGNLLANALKFTPAGGRVAIRAQRSGSGVEISVRDNGAGIAPEFLPFVFDRFRQGDSTTTRAHGGLGLGLAIARHLVELHGGTIRAESAGEHTGATFTIVLPVAAARQAAGRETPADSTSRSVAGVRVLAVDDQEDTRALLQTLLAEAGAIVDVAVSAPDGLQALTERRPDVLVADIAMPGEDGYSLIRAVRRDESVRHLPRLPAIALTAYARDHDRQRAEAAGFDRHLTKPVDAAALVSAVAELMSGSPTS